MKVYIVTMHRFGCWDTHSYIHCVSERKLQAVKMADAEEECRGGKYVARITEADTRSTDTKIIREIKPIEGFDCTDLHRKGLTA